MLLGHAPAPASGIARDASAVRNLSDLAELLRALRRREARQSGGSPRTYRQLAATTGWSHAVIGEYLNGATLPPTDRFSELVRLFGATGSELAPLIAARDRVAELRRPDRPPAATAPRGSQRAPRELPAPVPRFVGRAAQLGELDRLGQSGSDGLTVAAICGSGGVGKTALAVRWAHSSAASFPDGQLYIDLYGFAAAAPLDPYDALGRFLYALGIEPERLPTSTDARANQYRTLLAGRRMLVVLDNAANADQVRPLLPGSSSCMVVVTSRDSLAGLVAADGAHRIALDGLSHDESTGLLRALLGKRASTDPGAMETLARLCHGLPLALRVAAEVVDSRAETARLLNQLGDRATLLDHLDVGDHRSAVRSVLSWSVDRLSPQARRLFQLLGCAPGPDLPLAAVASLSDLSPIDCRRGLAELARAYLLIEASPGRYALPDVQRAYAAELLRTTSAKAEWPAAVRRLAEHYLEAARRAEADPARAWYASERVALLATARLARDVGLSDLADQLASALDLLRPSVESR